MKLITVQVQNYKCVEDSQEFSTKELTCLAGKNESGKTALLEALRRLNPVEGRGESQYQPLFEYPRRKYSTQRAITDPVLTTKWELSEDDIAEVEKKLGEGAIENPIVTVAKGYENRRAWTIPINDTEVVKHMRSSSGEEEETKQDPEQLAREILAKRLPKFLYFPNYGTLPGKISIDQFIDGTEDSPEEIEKHRHFQALLQLAGTTVEDLKNTARSEELVARLETVSNSMSDKVFEYWSQKQTPTGGNPV